MKAKHNRGIFFFGVSFVLITGIAFSYWWMGLEASDNSVLQIEVFDYNQSTSHLILAWTKFYSYPFAGLLNGSLHEANCPVKCAVSDDKRYISSASAVVFFWTSFDSGNLPKSRFSWQNYVFMAGESPIYSLGPKHIDPHFFNLTMTYRLDSDIVWTYDRLTPINGTANIPEKAKTEQWSWKEVLGKFQKKIQVRNAIAKKRRLVLQFVSHCDTHSGREIYVAELAQHIKVTIYGDCSGNTKCKEPECANQEIAAHKFYLAFENSVCRDYVTEKLWRLKQLIVPIVLRGEDYRGILPNGSYIAIDSFASPAKLAEYLLRLDRNNAEYAKYFEWTKSYFKSATGLTPGPACKLCQYLHEKNQFAKNVDIDRWWNYEGVCENGFALQTLQEILPWTRIWHSIKMGYLLTKRRILARHRRK